MSLVKTGDEGKADRAAEDVAVGEEVVDDAEKWPRTLPNAPLKALG